MHKVSNLIRMKCKYFFILFYLSNKMFLELLPPNQNNVFPTAPNDKFKIIQTAPEFAYADTGSYSFDSFKNSFKSTSKKPLTGSTVLTSGIINSNAPV